MPEKQQSEKPLQELRWNPLLQQWVMVSSERDTRPWRPSSECPFCPGSPEMGYGWRVKLVRNKYPMLRPDPPEPTRHYYYNTSPARGECYVLVETPDHNIRDVDQLPTSDVVEQIKTIIELTKQSMEKGYKYLFWFRNKGEEIGVSLVHLHSQVYVLDFVPSIIEKELESIREHYMNQKECMLCKIIEVEKKDGERIVYENNSWMAFIPFAPRWPFEVHLYPKRHISLITDLEEKEILDLAIAKKKVFCGLNRLFKKQMPYMMALHQAPLDEETQYYHLHFEIYGAYRSNGKLKYAAGMEMAGGNFTYDSIPEKNAEKLRENIKSCGE